MSARERVPRRGVSGRTHRSAPTRWGRRSEPTGIGAERCLSQRGGTEPAPYRGPEQGGGRVRLGCGFRQPNSETEFGASVKVTPPYGCNASGAKQRADVGIRPFSDGRGFGPPYLGHGLRRPNFVPKFGASVKSSAPTESPINHPSQPARSEASAPAWARDGRESVQRPSQKGDRRRDRPGSA